MKDLTLENRAYMFAAGAHAAVGQKRKFSGKDYIVHPSEVAMLVSLVCSDSEMIAAAYLHDTVEDTEVTLEQIEYYFGKVVAHYVENLTDVSKPEDGNRKTRKEIDRQHTAKAHPNAKTIKLADLIANTRDITLQDPKFAVVYMAEKVRLMEVLKEGDARLYAEAQELINEYYENRKNVG